MKFSNHTLLVVFEKDSSQAKSNFPKPSDVELLLGVDRNPVCQIYVLQDLYGCVHGTIANRDFRGDLVTSSSFKKTKPIPFIQVPCSSNYLSDDRKTIVINNDGLFNVLFNGSVVRHNVLERCAILMTEMMKRGLEDFFNFDNKKRSSTKNGGGHGSNMGNSNVEAVQCITKHVVTSKYSGCFQREVMINKKSIPVLSLGWTTTDCTKYSSNYSTIAGSIKPFIFDQGLPSTIKKHIITLVEFVLLNLPKDDIFDLSKIKDPEDVAERKRMLLQFKRHLGGDDVDPDITHFRAEGITFLIPASLGFHRDTLNDIIPGMKTVVSVNATIPINSSTIRSGEQSKLSTWLRVNGYTKSFPFSMILYTRNVVGSFCQKHAMHVNFSNKDILRKCIAWGVRDRVSSVVDYRSSVFYDPNFRSIFEKYSKVFKNGRFKGKIFVTPARYTKMVRDVSMKSIFLFQYINSQM